MSYMDHNASFAPVGGIQELSFDEVEQVDGGWIGAAVVVVAVVVLLAIGYFGEHNRDNEEQKSN